MNSLELTSEIRQIIESDIQLRKEYEAIRKAMNEYRNQLIASEELCRRQDVSIEVLKTKLENQGKELAMYKGEVEAFRELRDNFKTQLEEKNILIENLQSACRELEDKIKHLELMYTEDKNRLMEEYKNSLDALNADWKARLALKENEISGMRAKIESEYLDRIRHFEDVLSRLSDEKDREWKEKLSVIQESNRAEMERVLSEKMNEWQLRFEQREKELNSILASREKELNDLKLQNENLKVEYENLIQSKEAEFVRQKEDELNKMRSIITSKEDEIQHINLSLAELQNQLMELRKKMAQNEHEWQLKLNEQIDKYQRVSQEYKHIYDEKIKELEAIHESEKTLLIQQYEEQISRVKNEFEQKFSNLIYHTQLQKESLENELNQKKEDLEGVVRSLSEKESTIDNLNKKIEELKNEAEQLKIKNRELEEFNSVNLFQEEEKINKLKEEYEKVIAEKDCQIKSLEQGQENLAGLLENFINELNFKENHIKEINEILLSRDRELSDLKKSLSDFSQQKEAENRELQSAYESKILALEDTIKRSEENFASIIKEKENEFLKLLTENENLIREVESWEEKYSNVTSEFEILKSEYDELKLKTDGRIQEWREILESKNFEITNLQADLAGLKALNEKLENENKELSQKISKIESEKFLLDELKLEKEKFENLFLNLQSEFHTLSTQLLQLRDENLRLKSDLESYKLKAENNNRSEEDEKFIRKLFRQIDELYSEKLNLLEEKERMADQLLKMNEILENLSQSIDIQQIDTKNLNDHRKNVILATQNKPSNEGLKEKINELLYEIDKCIQLLG